MMAVEWAGRTGAGRIRRNNEDAFSVALMSKDGIQRGDEVGEVGETSDRGILFSVADGLGGQNAGEVASAIAVTAIAEELLKFSEPPLPLPNRECGHRMETAVRRTNTRISQEAVSDSAKRGMASTLSCLWLLGHRGIFGHVGDSRLYRFRAGALAQLSHDQSEVGRMVRAGKITDAEAKSTVGRNVIDQALGLRDEGFAPEIDWVEILPGDAFLLCSDGLVDRLLDKDLAASLRAGFAEGVSLADMADTLMKMAEESKSRDNVTVLLVRPGFAAGAAVLPPPPAQEETPPPARRTSSFGTAFASILVGAVLGAAGGYFWSPQLDEWIERAGIPFVSRAEAAPALTPAANVDNARLQALRAELETHRRALAESSDKLARADALLQESRSAAAALESGPASLPRADPEHPMVADVPQDDLGHVSEHSSEAQPPPLTIDDSDTPSDEPAADSP